jgi:hypothetical protein
VTRITAPLPSSTSEPHLSQTSTVFLATIPPSRETHRRDFYAIEMSKIRPPVYLRQLHLF